MNDSDGGRESSLGSMTQDEIRNIEQMALNDMNTSTTTTTTTTNNNNNTQRDQGTQNEVVIIHHHHHHHHHTSSTTINNTSTTTGNNTQQRQANNKQHNKSSNSPTSSSTPSESSLVLQNNTTSSSTNSNNTDITYLSLRKLSLQNLNAVQHFALAICRDISFVLPVLGFIQSINKAWSLNVNTFQKNIISSSLSGDNAEDAYLDFYKILFYIQQQDTKSLYLTFQKFWNYQYHNNSYMIINPIKYFYNNNNNSHNQSTATTTATTTSLLSTLSASPISTALSNITGSILGNTTNASSSSSHSSNSTTVPLIRQSYLSSIIRARSSEYLLCALWCVVSLYLTYVTLDALMVRWITKYSISAAILRMFSISLLLIIIEQFLISSLTYAENNNYNSNEFILHTWILISCILTGVYIWQSFWTSFLQQQRSNIRKKDSNTTTLQFWKYTLKKHLDLYNIIVFAVVPVGIASFITMVILLRNLVIQRMDVEQLEKIWFQINSDL